MEKLPYEKKLKRPALPCLERRLRLNVIKVYKTMETVDET